MFLIKYNISLIDVVHSILRKFNFLVRLEAAFIRWPSNNKNVDS